MKPIAVFVLVAAMAVATVAAGAKTVNSSQNSNDRTVSTVAGPAAAADNSHKTPDVVPPVHKKVVHKVRHKTRPAIQKD